MADIKRIINIIALVDLVLTLLTLLATIWILTEVAGASNQEDVILGWVAVITCLLCEVPLLFIGWKLFASSKKGVNLGVTELPKWAKLYAIFCLIFIINLVILLVFGIVKENHIATTVSVVNIVFRIVALIIIGKFLREGMSQLRSMAASVVGQ